MFRTVTRDGRNNLVDLSRGFAVKKPASEYMAEIEHLEWEVSDLRKQLERTSRKLTELQARNKELYDALRSIVKPDHPVLRGKKS